jgi:hypothetical protein
MFLVASFDLRRLGGSEITGESSAQHWKETQNILLVVIQSFLAHVQVKLFHIRLLKIF